MKNVLFVLPFHPYPLESGGHQAIYNGIDCVHNDVKVFVTYIEYGSSQQDERVIRFKHSLDNQIECVPYYLPLPSKKDHILELIYRLKFCIKKLLFKRCDVKKDDFSEWMSQILPKDNGFLCHIDELIRKYSIDIIQCEMLETAHVVCSVPSSVKTIFVEHEIGFVRKSLRLVEKGDKTFAGVAQVEINKCLEVALLNKFDTVVTLSDVDKTKLEMAGVNSDIHTSFAVVNTPINTNISSSESTVLSFVGPEWHPSNKAGLIWFLDNCWAQLNKSESYSLRVIGNWSNETSTILEQKYKGVHFCGYVEDLASMVANTIMIVPITIGSGIRMKILEACAIGVPVVSTTVGMEGLPLVSGENCFIADTPDAFVSSIKSLSDQSLRISFIKSSQAVISGRYSMTALRNNRLPIYE